MHPVGGATADTFRYHTPMHWDVVDGLGAPGLCRVLEMGTPSSRGDGDGRVPLRG